MTTKEKHNIAKIEALKTIKETQWVGNTTHETLDKCLVALNLETTNSGWYQPKAIRIPGLSGIFMVNEDGSIFCEARIIREDKKTFKIEYMTMAAWNLFESRYFKNLGI